MKKTRWLHRGKAAALLLAIVLLCCPLLSGKLVSAVNGAELNAEPAIAATPGAYDADVYELVGYTAKEAAQFHASASQQVDDTVLARLLYISDMQIGTADICKIDFTDKETLAEVQRHYESFLSYGPEQKQGVLDAIQFDLDTRHMTADEKIDCFYRMLGFPDGKAGYMAYLEETDKISDEENARRLKEDADKQRKKMEALGIDCSGMTDAELANP